MRTFFLAFLMAFCLAAPAQAAQVTVEGRSVHYTDRGSGRAVIFVHGWTCDESSWAGQVPALAGKYRVITLDLPGHGRSDLPARGDYSMSAFADAVEAVRAAARAGRVVLVGHSMGAGVIRRYALRYPNRVAGLVAVDGPLDVRPFANWPVSQPAMTPEARGRLIDTMFVPQTPSDVRQAVRTMMLGTSEEAAVGSSGSMFDRANQSDQLIQAPAMTIYAGMPLFPIDPKTVEMLPRWTWSQISGTGHFVMIERAAEFNRRLTSFLARKARY